MLSTNKSFSAKNNDAKSCPSSECGSIDKSKGLIEPNLTNNSKMPSDESSGLSCVYNSESAQAKTILITNNYSLANNLAHNQMDSSSNNIKKSSITIYTHNSDSEGPANSQPGNALVYDRINILINNHYDRPVKKEFEEDTPSLGSKLDLHQSISTSQIKKEKKEKEKDVDDFVEKDDRKLEKYDEKNGRASYGEINYSVGDDVLVAQKDGRFYLGTIVAVRFNKTLVKFDDNTERWSTFKEITKLKASTERKAPMCVACKNTADRNAVVKVCEGCSRGYHRECSQGSAEEDGNWYCKRCTAKKKQRNDTSSNLSIKENEFEIVYNNQLPYDLNSLNWDVHHRQNLEHKYCYCGENGKWYMQMLQCARCLQWFHQNCIKSLNYPLYFGDRFYLFACSTCNHGEEFVRRLHMKIEDVVHLLIFNLMIHHSKRYYSISNVIVPYARENWHALQLTPKLKNMMSTDIKDEIGRALKANTMRFKSGKEGKHTTYWALKSRAPPKAPVIALPPGQPLSEKYLNDLFSDQARIHFLPRKLCSSSDSVANDLKMRNIMTGRNYVNFIEKCDNESSCSDNESTENVFTSASDKEMLAKLLVNTNFANQRLKDYHLKDTSGHQFDEGSQLNHSSDHSFNGFEGFVTNDVDKKKNKRLSKGTGLPAKRGRPRMKPEKRSAELYDSSDDTSSRGTLDSIIPPPKDFRGSNNPFVDEHKGNGTVPVVTTPKNGLSLSSFGLGTSSLMTGKNVSVSVPKNGMQMVRTVKRRLSARDIRIGPNMEVKRRKLKRQSGDVEIISTVAIQDLPSSTAYLPIRTDSKTISVLEMRSTINSNQFHSDGTNIPIDHTNSLIGSVSGRRLRHRLRQDDADGYTAKSLFNSANERAYDYSTSTALPSTSTFDATTFGSGIPGSPIKTDNQEVSIANLQSTVNQYFGAANRIASGENFVIKGKRVGMDGRVQYLIEWDSV